MTERPVGNLHSVALIDLQHAEEHMTICWEPSFCSLDRLNGHDNMADDRLGTFIL